MWARYGRYGRDMGEIWEIWARYGRDEVGHHDDDLRGGVRREAEGVAVDHGQCGGAVEEEQEQRAARLVGVADVARLVVQHEDQQARARHEAVHRVVPRVRGEPVVARGGARDELQVLRLGGALLVRGRGRVGVRGRGRGSLPWGS